MSLLIDYECIYVFVSFQVFLIYFIGCLNGLISSFDSIRFCLAKKISKFAEGLTFCTALGLRSNNYFHSFGEKTAKQLQAGLRFQVLQISDSLKAKQNKQSCFLLKLVTIWREY